MKTNTLVLAVFLFFQSSALMVNVSAGEIPVGACNHYDENKRPYFGDLHVHTSYSLDSAMFDNKNNPDNAYRFAKGEAVGIAPYDSAGNPLRMAQLLRPLDFAGVSDHADFLAEADVCFNLDSFQYFSAYCTIVRGSSQGKGLVDSLAVLVGLGQATLPGGTRIGICNKKWNKNLCQRRESKAWARVKAAAEAHYDRSSQCSFTTFIGYEWMATPNFKNAHRLVYFKDENVPKHPVPFHQAWTPLALWKALDSGCTEANPDCEVLTIPHTSNLGGGEMFSPFAENGAPYTAENAATRQRMEPVVEIYQHKGTSECVNTSLPYGSNDEQCNFEMIIENVCTGSSDDADDCKPLCSEGGATYSVTGACIEPSDFTRAALKRGLMVGKEIGVNPFQVGFVGGTDTHNGTPGATSEFNWKGHSGSEDDQLVDRIGLADAANNPMLDTIGKAFPRIKDIAGLGDQKVYGPGGLAVVWAQQNSRHSLFESIQKRETYATSGTRITLRMFAGDNIDMGLCDDPDFAAKGYEQGFPMGSEIPSASGSMRIAVSAAMDPGVSEMALLQQPVNRNIPTHFLQGTPLQRVQIVKGWIEDNQTHEKVYDIAGDPSAPSGVDPDTCRRWGVGHKQLCRVWQDPDFSADQSAFYYARVLENPSCRWSKIQCNAQLASEGLTCDAVRAEKNHPLKSCCDGSMADFIQERAWSSPVWYSSNEK